LHFSRKANKLNAKVRKERIRNLCALCGFIFAAFARNFFHAKQYKMNAKFAKKSDDRSLRCLTFFPPHKATKGYVFATFATSPLRALRETLSKKYFS